jgi:hypothetical protein
MRHANNKRKPKGARGAGARSAAAIGWLAVMGYFMYMYSG